MSESAGPTRSGRGGSARGPTLSNTRSLLLTLVFVLGSGCGEAGDTIREEASRKVSATETVAPEPTTPTESASPTETLPNDPPWGLDTVTLPSGAASIEATFEAFPETVRGKDRLSVDFSQTAFGAAYGGEGSASSILAIKVVDYTSRDPHPARTVGEFFARFMSADDPLMEELDADASGGLLWHISKQAGGGSVREFVGGAPRSRWIFAVLAVSPGMREELVKTLVEALRTD